MSEKLKIKISIADRVYPLTVDPSQEEGLRSASKKIDAMIKQFEQSYAVRDKQDLLAMCALQFAAQVEQKQISATEKVVSPKPKKEKTVEENDQKRNQIKKLNSDLKKAEQALADLENKKSEIESALSLESNYSDVQKLNELNVQYEAVKRDIETAQSQWEQIAEQLMQLEE